MMKTFLHTLLCQSNPLNVTLDAPVLYLLFPAIVGAVASVLLQYRKNQNRIHVAGKVLLGIGTGYFCGAWIASKTGLSEVASSFFCGTSAPVILSLMKESVHLKDESGDDDSEDDL